MSEAPLMRQALLRRGAGSLVGVESSSSVAGWVVHVVAVQEVYTVYQAFERGEISSGTGAAAAVPGLHRVAGRAGSGMRAERYWRRRLGEGLRAPTQLKRGLWSRVAV